MLHSYTKNDRYFTSYFLRMFSSTKSSHFNTILKITQYKNLGDICGARVRQQNEPLSTDDKEGVLRDAISQCISPIDRHAYWQRIRSSVVLALRKKIFRNPIQKISSDCFGPFPIYVTHNDKITHLYHLPVGSSVRAEEEAVSVLMWIFGGNRSA